MWPYWGLWSELEHENFWTKKKKKNESNITHQGHTQYFSSFLKKSDFDPTGVHMFFS